MNKEKNKEAYEIRQKNKQKQQEFKKVATDAKKAIKAIVPHIGSSEFSAKNEITPANRRYWNVAETLPYVMWGQDNLLPQCIVEYCLKDNVIAPVTAALQRILAGDRLEYKTGLAKPFLEDMGIEEVIDRIAWDLVLLDGFCVNVKTGKVKLNGESKDVVTELIPVNFADIRADKRNTFRRQTGFFYAYDWSMVNLLGQVNPMVAKYPQYEPIEMLPYDISYKDSLYYDNIYKPSGKYYPTPLTQTVQSLVEISFEAIRFHVSYLKNGVIGSIVMSIPVNMDETDPEKTKQLLDELTQKAHEEWARTVNAGKPFISVVPINPLADDYSPPEVKISGFPQDANDKRHLDLVRFVREEKFIGLGIVAPEAFGLPSQGASTLLGQAEVMEMAYAITKYFQIEKRTKKIEKFINKIIADMGIMDSVEIISELPTKPINRHILDQTVTKQ